MRRMPLVRAAFVLVAALGLALVQGSGAQAQTPAPIKLGYAKCAHCTPMSLTPDYAKGAKVEAIGFNTGNDALTALVSKSVDVVQVTYLHYVTALDRGFDVVAVSGQISGGSTILAVNDLPVGPNDWAGLKALVATYKADGKPFRVAASRGNAQDIHMRGAFAKQGIDVNRDVAFVNIPNPSDHLQALRRGEVEMISTVEPFATQILQSGGAKLFTHPYDQPAGNLTNIVLTRPDVIAANPQGVQAVVGAVVAINERLSADHAAWADVIVKVTGLDRKIAEGAIANLTPDASLHREQAIAIAAMMRDLKYISKDVTAAVAAKMDYRFLEAATGKPKTELGE